MLEPAELKARRLAPHLKCAFATLLYDDANGYAHGVVALMQSLAETETPHSLVCLVGKRLNSTTRTAVAAMGARLVDVDSDDNSFGEASSALPALGLGQCALNIYLYKENRVQAGAVVSDGLRPYFVSRRGRDRAPKCGRGFYRSGL